MNLEGRDVIGIGASAGGVLALLELLPLLPADLPASLLIVLHRHPTAASSLPLLFGRKSRLPVVEPRNGEPVEKGVVYVAPRDQHMTLVQGHLRLDRTPKQHYTRPAIDPLFHSIAAYKQRAVGVLLTGTLADGVAGLIAIKEAGGITLAQDPHEAPFPSMPINAIIADNVDRILRINELGPFLYELAVGASPHPG